MVGHVLTSTDMLQSIMTQLVFQIPDASKIKLYFLVWLTVVVWLNAKLSFTFPNSKRLPALQVSENSMFHTVLKSLITANFPESFGSKKDVSSSPQYEANE
jgi:hypothetical protein